MFLLWLKFFVIGSIVYWTLAAVYYYQEEVLRFLTSRMDAMRRAVLYMKIYGKDYHRHL